MNKYSNILSKSFRFVWGMFCIIFGVAFIGFSFWGSYAVSPEFSMILIIAFLGGGFIINYGVGYAFLGDEYRLSPYVHDGESTFEVVETPKLLGRRMWVTFLGSIAYAGLAIFYLVRTLQLAKIEGANAVLIGCIIVSVIMAVIFFLFAGKTKIEYNKISGVKKTDKNKDFIKKD